MNNVAELMLLCGAVIFILLVTLKTYFFYKSTQRPSFRRWFYFTYVDIEGSKDDSKKKLKRRQNYYSLALLLFIFLFLVLFYVVVNMKNG